MATDTNPTPPAPGMFLRGWAVADFTISTEIAENGRVRFLKRFPSRKFDTLEQANAFIQTLPINSDEILLAPVWGV